MMIIAVSWKNQYKKDRTEGTIQPLIREAMNAVDDAAQRPAWKVVIGIVSLTNYFRYAYIKNIGTNSYVCVKQGRNN